MTFDELRKELPNAQIVAWTAPKGSPSAGFRYAAFRQERGAAFCLHEGRYSEEQILACVGAGLVDVRVLESFPGPGIEDLVGDAVAFTALRSENRNVPTTFGRGARTGAWFMVGSPTPHSTLGDLSSSYGIDFSTIVPLVPKGQS